MRNSDHILRGLKRISVDGHRCFGCGQEHNCSIHGCAIIREAMELIQQLQGDLAESEKARSELGKRLASAQQALCETKSERDALERDLKGCVDSCSACAHANSNPDCDGECGGCASPCPCWECDVTASKFTWRGRLSDAEAGN